MYLGQGWIVVQRLPPLANDAWDLGSVRCSTVHSCYHQFRKTEVWAVYVAVQCIQATISSGRLRSGQCMLQYNTFKLPSVQGDWCLGSVCCCTVHSSYHQFRKTEVWTVYVAVQCIQATISSGRLRSGQCMLQYSAFKLPSVQGDWGLGFHWVTDCSVGCSTVCSIISRRRLRYGLSLSYTLQGLLQCNTPGLCANGGTCVETMNSAHCLCPPGFTGPTCSGRFMYKGLVPFSSPYGTLLSR